MSLEQSIATLTTEVANLIEEMRSMSAELRAVTAAVAAEIDKGADKAPAEKKPETVKPAAEPEPAPVADPEPAPKADEPYQPTITDTELKNAFVNLVNQKGRQAMTDILTDFGATKFSELPKDKYRDIDAAILKAMD